MSSTCWLVGLSATAERFPRHQSRRISPPSPTWGEMPTLWRKWWTVTTTRFRSPVRRRRRRFLRHDDDDDDFVGEKNDEMKWECCFWLGFVVCRGEGEWVEACKLCEIWEDLGGESCKFWMRWMIFFIFGKLHFFKIFYENQPIPDWTWHCGFNYTKTIALLSPRNFHSGFCSELRMRYRFLTDLYDYHVFNVYSFLSTG